MQYRYPICFWNDSCQLLSSCLNSTCQIHAKSPGKGRTLPTYDPPTTMIFFSCHVDLMSFEAYELVYEVENEENENPTPESGVAHLYIGIGGADTHPGQQGRDSTD